MFAVGCNKEMEKAVPNGDTIKAVFTIQLPETVATKAINDGLNATELLFRAYNESNVLLPQLNKTVAVSGRTATVELELVKDLYYQFVFWAQTPGKYTIAEDGQSITAAPSLNDGTADAFYWHEPVFQVTAAFNKAVTLTRPFAQINVGAVAGDFTAAQASNIATDDNLKTGYTIAGLPNTLNLITGEVSGNVDISGASVDNCVSHPTEALKVGDVNYDYAALLYVLASDEKTTKDVTIDLWTKQTITTTNIADKHFTRVVPNVPIVRNYRTNILGRIFTVGAAFQVTVDQNFQAPTDNQGDYVPEYATIDALNTAFAAGQAIGYRVAVTTPDDGTIVLPKTNDDVRIFFRGDWSANTVELEYATGATAAEKPVNVYILAPALGTLNGVITSTHVEIETGSYIENGSLATSGGTLVVQPNAYIGILTITGGSLQVDGEVEKATIKLAAAEAGSTVSKADDGEITELIIETGTVVLKGEYDNVTAKGDDTTVSVPEGSSVTNLTAASGSEVNVEGSVDVVVASGTGTTVDLSEATEVGSVTQDGNADVITDPSTYSPYVCQIGAVEYESLADAIAAVEAGVPTTIVMTASHAIIGNAGVVIPAGKEITIDLNGKTISNRVNEDKASQVITNLGTLTITDSSADKNGVITNYALEGTHVGEWWSTPQYNYATNTITNTGTLIVEAGNINNTAAGSICYCVDNNSASYDVTLVLKGGTIEKNGTAFRMFCNSATKKNKLEIPAGSTGSIIGAKTAFWVQLPGSNASSMKQAELDIAGGTIKGNTYAFYDYSYGDGWDNVVYNITGGEFIGWIYSYKENYQFITGGTFTEDPSDYVVAPEYWAEENSDGTYSVVPAPPVASIGSTDYYSLGDAFAAAPTDGSSVTIQLKRSVSYNVNKALKVNANQKIVLDLAGYEIIHNAPNAAVAATIENFGDLTINDSSTGKTGKISMTGIPDSNWLYGIWTIDNRKTLTINGGTIENLSPRGLGFAVHTGAYGTSTSTTINGGVISHPAYCAFCLYYQQSGTQTAVINGGEFIGDASPIWFQICTNNPSYDVTINGGTINSTSDKYGPIYIWAYNTGFDATNVHLSIAGGTILSPNTSLDIVDWDDVESAFINTNKNVISGGSFFTDPTAILAPNATAQFNSTTGLWDVQ